MNPEIKAEWIERLREPDRKQTTSFLNVTGQGQCCLGVLCEMAEEQGVVQSKTYTRLDGKVVTKYFSREGVDDNWQELPIAVSKWAGLDEENPYNSNPVVKVAGIENNHLTLAELNDQYHYTFNQIADVIEVNL